MTAHGDTALLERVLAALERGEDPAAIRAAHAEHAEEIDRWVAAAGRYADLIDAARAPAEPAGRLGTLAPGDRLGDFVVDALLDRGGEGEVYRARQLSLGERAVALKVLRGDAPSERARARFAREALTLADLHHPGLAEVFGFGAERGVLFLAMRLIEGPSLLDVQKRLRRAGERTPPAAARPALVAFATQVCAALASIHARGLIHRDVKPANVIVEGGGDAALPEGRAVLVDFGLARPIAASAVTRAGLAPATELYAPPEQLSGAELDASADVFALGATLHDLLAGTLPGERGRAAAGLPPLADVVAGIDLDLAAVVRKACELDRTWRYADAGALYSDLRAWQRGDKVSARRPPLRERARRWIQAHPAQLLRTALLSASIVAVGVAAAGIGGWRGAAARARAAWEAGDLVALDQAAAEVPAALRGLFLERGPLAETAARLAGDAPGPLGDVVQRLSGQDAEGAFLAAAEALERGGLAGEPALARLFLSALSPAADADRRSLALRVTARLFYERPVDDPAARDAAAPWRAALLALSDAGVLDAEDELFRISALSGCGDPADAAPILAAALGRPRGSEPERLGMRAAERILRRGMRAGGLAEADLAGIADLLRPLLIAQGAAFPSEMAAASMDQLTFQNRLASTLESVTFACRAVGLDPGFARELPAEWRATLEAAGPIDWRALEVLVSAPDERLAGLLESGRFQAAHGHDPDLLARCCASIGCCASVADSALAAEVRGRLAERAGPDAVARFDDALEAWQDWILGARPAYDLDSDTHLVAPSAAGEPLVLSAEHLGPRDGLVAAWDLQEPIARLTGAARSLAAVGGRREADRVSSYLVLSQSGRSRAVLDYEVAPEFTPRWGLLRLDHADAARAYYPYAGSVELWIEIDGQVLDADRRIARMDTSGRSVLEVAPEFLAPGRHRIDVRLGRATNTTYRLMRVELVPFEDFPPYRDGQPR